MTPSRLASCALVAILAALAVLAVSCGGDQGSYGARDDSKIGPRLAASCLYSHSSYADPIIKPTTTPPAHSHLFYGNESTDQNSTLQSLQGATSRCKQGEDKSAWWVPQTRWGDTDLKTGTLVIYYQVTPTISAEKIRPFPPGFQAIGRQPSFRCGDGDFTTTAPQRCGADKFSVRVDFNQCYDPDDPTVEANLAPPGRAGCPASHPVLLPQIQVQQNFQLSHASGPLTVAGNDGWMLPASMHADFVNAWDQPRLKELVGLCLRQTGEQEERPDVCRTAK